MSRAAADALVAARRAAGLSQEALAERAGVSSRTVRMLESGQAKRPHRDTLLAVGRTLRHRGDALERFVRSWRVADRAIVDLFGDRPFETALFDELARQRQNLREVLTAVRVAIGPDRRWVGLSVRRTFEVVETETASFLYAMSLPTGQEGDVDTDELVNVEVIDSLRGPGAGARAVLLGFPAPLRPGEHMTIGYGIAYRPFDGSPEVATDDEAMFAVGRPVAALTHEITFADGVHPRRVCRTRQDVVEGDIEVTGEVAVSAGGVAYCVEAPATSGVVGVRWEWE